MSDSRDKKGKSVLEETCEYAKTEYYIQLYYRNEKMSKKKKKKRRKENGNNMKNKMAQKKVGAATNMSGFFCKLYCILCPISLIFLYKEKNLGVELIKFYHMILQIYFFLYVIHFYF